MASTVRIKELPQHVGEKVSVDGWLYNKRASGKLQFPIIRDGSGYFRGLSKKEVSEESWNDGTGPRRNDHSCDRDVVAEPRAPGGVELQRQELVSSGCRAVSDLAKEHGTDSG